MQSIDAFLSRRKEYEEIGKLSIAFQLILSEHENVIHRTNNNDDWYSLLWSVMTDEVHTASGLNLIGRNISFVTFNYDRSLEYFFFAASKYSFGLSDEDALTFVGNLKILHIYGQLGCFHKTNEDAFRSYKPAISGKAISIAAQGIRIIPESRNDDDIFLKAREYFEWAERICFLGFGFDSLNMARLSINSVREWMASKDIQLPEVYCSSYGKTSKEVQELHNKYFSLGGATFLSSPNLQFLRETGVLSEA